MSIFLCFTLISFSITLYVGISVSLFFSRLNKGRLTHNDNEVLNHLDEFADYFNNKYEEELSQKITGIEVLKTLVGILLAPYVNLLFIIGGILFIIFDNRGENND